MLELPAFVAFVSPLVLAQAGAPAFLALVPPALVLEDAGSSAFLAFASHALWSQIMEAPPACHE